MVMVTHTYTYSKQSASLSHKSSKMATELAKPKQKALYYSRTEKLTYMTSPSLAIKRDKRRSHL